MEGNLKDFKSKIEQNGALLIVVSKNQPVDKILDVYNNGQRHFGENKVQELVEKYEVMPKDIHWHLIGHLQRNKVKYIAPFVHLVHSVDSLELLQEIDKQGRKCNRIISCLLQVYIAKEETKFGFSIEEIKEVFSTGKIDHFDFVNVIGLMGMASFTDNSDIVDAEFQTLSDLFQELKANCKNEKIKLQQLSMGMSGDYEIALRHGSTMVRIGTAIFGKR